MNYLSYYGMSHNPFEKGENLKDIYETSDFKQALSRLEYLKKVKGIGVFTGNPGVGKSRTLQYFATQLNPSLHKIIYLPISTLTVLDFYKALAYGLGIEPAFKKIDIFKQIQETIEHMNKEKRITPVILLDEAQYLKTEVLNDLKILMNFEMDSRNYCIVILAGGNVLKNILSKNIHEALHQRIVIQYTFGGLEKKEAKDYVDKQMHKAGVGVPIFNEGAIEAIYSCCNGSIRKMNRIVTNCLIVGRQQKEETITTDIVMQAQNEVELI